MKKPLKGQLGVLINRYLQVRRSLGYIHRNAEYTLNEFDRYLSQHFPNAKTVTRPMVIGFLSSNSHLQASSVYIRFISLRQFCRFLFQLNPATYVPETRLIPTGPTVRRPHIYMTAEAMKLIKLASMLTPEGSLRPYTYSTLISLLWISGLRIGEALSLLREHFQTDQFHKTSGIALGSVSQKSLRRPHLTIEHGKRLSFLAGSGECHFSATP